MRHVEARHLQNPSGVTCQLCSKVFKTRDSLRKHKADHFA
jgi:hypothetical protein